MADSEIWLYSKPHAWWLEVELSEAGSEAEMLFHKCSESCHPWQVGTREHVTVRWLFWSGTRIRHRLLGLIWAPHDLV